MSPDESAHGDCNRVDRGLVEPSTGDGTAMTIVDTISTRTARAPQVGTRFDSAPSCWKRVVEERALVGPLPVGEPAHRWAQSAR
jgi:hypothetical protein